MVNSVNKFWEETSPGKYERNVDELEQLYTTLAKMHEGTGHTFFAITACVTLTVPTTIGESLSYLEAQIEKAFRHSWKQMRYDHPTLAAPVVYDPDTESCKKVYQTPQTASEVNDWLEETFKVIDKAQTGQEFANSDPPIGRFATLYLVTPRHDSHQSEMTKELVLHSPHDIIDGVGTLMLLDNLIRVASEAFSSLSSQSEVVFGDESKNLSPHLRVAGNIPPTRNAAQEKKLQEIQSANADARKDTEILTLPFNSVPEIAGNSTRIAINLSPTDTQAVLARCKALGVTPTHAFHAGIALALRDLQEKGQDERKARYIGYSLNNLRQSCKEPYNSPQHAAAVYHSASAYSLVIDVVIPAVGQSKIATKSLNEFELALNQVKDFYQSWTPDADFLSMVPFIATGKLPPYSPETGPVPPPDHSPSVSLSSMGVLDRIIKPQRGVFKVENPWVIGAEYRTGMGLFLSTWEGVLCLGAGYNDAYHSQDEVLRFLESVKDIVLAGLVV